MIQPDLLLVVIFLMWLNKQNKICAEISFANEATVRSHFHQGASWGKIGKKPIVNNCRGRFGLNLISAVTDLGYMRISFIDGKINSSIFIIKEGKKDDRIVMAFLPTYSPKLNPDEQVWNHAKPRLAKLQIIDNDSRRKSYYLY